MPQFTVADRETVKEKLDESSDVYDVSPVGNGLLVQRCHNASSVVMFQSMAEEAGWYVASYEIYEAGDRYIIAPFGSGSE